jgi:uncharacterized protein YuzE
MVQTAQPLVTIAEKPACVRWDYDAEADCLYLSVGPPRPAEGVEIGDGLVALYDHESGELVGLTIYGLRERLVEQLAAIAAALAAEEADGTAPA